MARVSKESASQHTVIPNAVDAYGDVVDGWDVTIERDLMDMDAASFFKGGPKDMCPASHLGYVLRGRFGVRWSDGTQEIFEAGDAFVLKPGHTPIMFDGCEYVAFTPAEEAKQQMQVMMPNVTRFAQEHGIQLPAEMANAAS